MLLIEGYEVDGDELLSEHPLVDPDESELAELLGLDDVDELYAFGYELTQEQLDFLVRRYNLDLPTQPQVYFLASFADQ
jgi:hypothetical protein